MREVGIPEHHDGRVEEDRYHGRNRNVDGRGQSDRGGKKDVNRVLAVIECIAKPHGRHNTGEAEGKGETVLHQHDDTGNNKGQHYQKMHD